MLGTLTQEHWIRYLAQDFRIDHGGVALTMRLASVTGFKHSSDRARECYSLVFYGPSNPALPQRIYRLAHDEVGEVEIFLVPIGPQKDGFGYEAIFN